MSQKTIIVVLFEKQVPDLWQSDFLETGGPV
jgi:hypothetical protein